MCKVIRYIKPKVASVPSETYRVLICVHVLISVALPPIHVGLIFSLEAEEFVFPAAIKPILLYPFIITKSTKYVATLVPQDEHSLVVLHCMSEECDHAAAIFVEPVQSLPFALSVYRW